jgi:hypothetical protein
VLAAIDDNKHPFKALGGLGNFATATAEHRKVDRRKYRSGGKFSTGQFG